MHSHMAFWIVGSPRIDKIAVPKECDDHVVEISACSELDVVLPEVEAASRMASFWDRVVTEYNVAKALSGADNLQGDTGTRQKLGKKKEKEHPSPESISYQTYAHCLLGTVELPDDAESKRCWEELESILAACSRTGSAIPPSEAGEEQQQNHAYARKVFVAALAEWVNVHDLHKPFAIGPPSKDQACACVENEHSHTQ